MTTERIDELIALAALGELTEAEARELGDAAAQDPTVATEVAAAEEAAAAFGELVAEPPRATLRAEVLGAIAGVDQVAAAGPTPVAESADVVHLADRSRNTGGRRSRRLVRDGLLAVAAAAVLVVGGALLVRDDVGDDDPIAAIVEADDVVRRDLTGDLEGSVSVAFSPSAEAIVVDGVGLAPLAERRLLVLWLVADGTARPVGEFRPGDDGTVRVRVDGVDPTGSTLAITEETEGEIGEPTLPILASA